MTRSAHQPHEWLTLGTGTVAAVVWASLGVRALVAPHEPSGRALLGCAAMALVGFVLGPVTWLLMAPRRAQRSGVDALAAAETGVPHAMLGILLAGIGASPITDGSAGGWSWALMVAASLVGGLNLGLAFAMVADQAVLSSASRQRTTAR